MASEKNLEEHREKENLTSDKAAERDTWGYGLRAEFYGFGIIS